MLLQVLVGILVCLLAYISLVGGKFKHVPTVDFLRLWWSKKNIHIAISELSQQQRSDFIHVSFFVMKRLVGTHPDIAKTMLQGDNVVFEKEILRLQPDFDCLYFDSILFASGEKWKSQRGTMTPSFAYDFLQNLVPLFVSKTERMFSFMDVQGEKKVDVLPYIKKFTVDVIGEAALAQEFDLLSGKNSPYFSTYEKMMSIGAELFLFIVPGYSKLPLESNRLTRAYSQDIWRLSREYIAKRRSLDKRECLLDLIVHNPEMSEEEVVNNLFLFFLAGHETTASALGWTIHYLAKFPEIQERLRAEVLSVLGTDTQPTYENIKKLSYTDMVIKESMRIRPPVGQILGRISKVPLEIGSLSIPAKTPMSVSVYAIHHHPDFWPEPERFNPERFSPENSVGRHPFAFLPFSLGKRHCIGQNFSMIEQRIFVAMLMQRFTLEHCEDPVEKGDFVLLPPGSVTVKLIERKK